MSICQPSMNVDSDITTSETVNKVKPAAFDKPLYEFDRNQAGLMIYISESTIIYYCSGCPFGVFDVFK